MRTSVYNEQSSGSKKKVFFGMLAFCAVLAGCGGGASMSELKVEANPQNDETILSIETTEITEYSEQVISDTLNTSDKSDTFTDPRDGKEYRHTGNKLSKTWMGENLNFETDNSWCYGNDESNCEKFGRLYDWHAAMKACPAGWRLPAREEWNDLVTEIGDHGEASRKLKSTTGWRDDMNGTDEFGFTAIPSGHRNAAGTFRDVGSGGFWWSATVYEDGKAWSRLKGWVFGIVDEYSDNKSYGFSVRCIRE